MVARSAPPLVTPDHVSEAAQVVARESLGATDRHLTPAEAWLCTLAGLLASDRAEGLPPRRAAEVRHALWDAERIVRRNRRLIRQVAERFAAEDSAAGVGR